MYCLDANVWIYFLDAGCPEHDALATDVETVIESKPIFTTTVLQMEIVHYLRTQLGDSDDPVEAILSMEDTTVAELTQDDVSRAAELLERYDDVGIGGRDATVLAAMRRHDVSRLWTHDEGMKRMTSRLDWLDVTDPVEA